MDNWYWYVTEEYKFLMEWGVENEMKMYPDKIKQLSLHKLGWRSE